ncbi:MAG: NAD(P)/FAD-dependent oxidoreductase [Candidatus Omnitrophica bacterium]|nr:NAD(P)/FAD-dependent oxidoreductase [Candidatus Omnitrophota bacterium]
MSDGIAGSEIFDIAVLGGGAAGCMAAIRAGALKKKVALIERNDSIGKKILITGKGRCNITNVAPIETFIERFGKSGKFLRTAFFKFFNTDLVEFFRLHGLEMKTERQGRVFPVTDKARSVVDVLVTSLAQSGVEVICKSAIRSIKTSAGSFQIELEGGRSISAKKVILALGGASYKATGSMGDGFDIAVKLGHSITPLKPALVPLTTKETWVKDLQGLGLEHIRLTFECGKKRLLSEIGELMFTHFGVSGPLVLDLSGEVVFLLEDHKPIRMLIDLKPALTVDQLEKRMLNDLSGPAGTLFKSVMKGYLPQKLIPVFMRLANIDSEREANQVTQKERRLVLNFFKALPLTIKGALPIEEAMVTSGGVSIREINPRTMESRLVPGLYFAGEVMDGGAPSGGYNLQQAFSTGYLAGDSAAA